MIAMSFVTQAKKKKENFVLNSSIKIKLLLCHSLVRSELY